LASKKEKKEEARRLREEREAAERKKQRRKRRIWQIGAAVVVTVAVIVIAVMISGSGDDPDQKVSTKEEKAANDRFAGIAQGGITLGNPQAKVTIYEFADLQCPFCKQFTEGPFHQIVQKYVKPGKVKLVWRNLTFIGSDSVTAARAAAAAGAQNRLWTFIDLFYQNQGTENTGYVTDTFLEDIGHAAGLDVAKMKSDMSAPFVEEELGTAQNQANEFGINSTPSFLIQVGKEKPQKLEYENFELESFTKPIDEALARVPKSK